MKRTTIERNAIAVVGYNVELSNVEMRGVQHIASLIERKVSGRLAQFKEEVGKDGTLPNKRPVVKLDLEDALNLNAFLQRIACCHLDSMMFMHDNELAKEYGNIVGISYPKEAI